jgi:hypothetical protein
MNMWLFFMIQFALSVIGGTVAGLLVWWVFL